MSRFSEKFYATPEPQTQKQIVREGASSAEGETQTGFDATAVLSDHMYKFTYGPTNNVTDVVKQLSSQAAGMAKNASTISEIDRVSGGVKDSLQNHAITGAEMGQRRVVEMTKQLDLTAISAAIGAQMVEGAATPLVQALKLAGATPLVERVRLGAIQLKQSRQLDAEKSFEDAYKADIARESSALPEVTQLKLAAQKMFEELKLRRTLPEVFDSNLTLIDSSKDGAINRAELLNSRKLAGNSSMTQGLIEYLLKNFDQMKNGDTSINRADVLSHHQKIAPKIVGK